MYMVIKSLLTCQAQTALIELIPYEKPLTEGKVLMKGQLTIVPTEELEYLILKMMMLKHRPLVDALRYDSLGATS
jgi:hypothetical protein